MNIPRGYRAERGREVEVSKSFHKIKTCLQKGSAQRCARYICNCSAFPDRNVRYS